MAGLVVVATYPNPRSVTVAPTQPDRSAKKVVETASAMPTREGGNGIQDHSEGCTRLHQQHAPLVQVGHLCNLSYGSFSWHIMAALRVLATYMFVLSKWDIYIVLVHMY
ncbi:hypothetical protein OsI_39010 [Oryza sativa Indica Group]|nr:hypothetical protein LOC_Os12g41050 [Oryza sativa Japonica Group]EAY83794.1 hypothetical protein OsI_39010 [Oryza sativa Indica Group]